MRRDRNRSALRGLTLVEMLFTLIILGVVAGALFMTSLISEQSYDSAGAYVDVQQQTRWAFDKMVNELRQGGGAITTAPNQLTFQLALGFNDPTPGCPAGAVCFGAIDSTGTKQWNWSIRYQVVVVGAQSQLRRKILNAAGAEQSGERVLANDVTSATFTLIPLPPDTNTVRIQLQVQRTSSLLPGGSMGTSLDTRVRLRNL